MTLRQATRSMRRKTALALCAATLMLGANFGMQPISAHAAAEEDDIGLPNLSGRYLAAIVANRAQDAERASRYFRDVISLDPETPELTHSAFISLLTNGEIPDAAKLAKELMKRENTGWFPRSTLGVVALRKRAYKQAQKYFSEGDQGDQVTRLVSGILNAWSLHGEKKTDLAIETLGQLEGPGWYDLFRSYHNALMLHHVGRNEEARKEMEKALEIDSRSVPMAATYARILSRLGDDKAALDHLRPLYRQAPGNRILGYLVGELEKGRSLKPTVSSAQSGAAEGLYGIGTLLAREGGAEAGSVMLRLALHLDEEHELAIMSMADQLEAVKQYDKANALYAQLDNESVLQPVSVIQTALNLERLEKTDDAIGLLEELIKTEKSNLSAINTLGNLLRSKERYEDAALVYSKGISTIPQLQPGHWSIYYTRGIAYERSKDWPKAEADFRKALDLSPDQPLVLNYLGYSWVDRGENYDEALDMIKKAVEQRPQDGYIVDSLGWVYYKLERFEEAVPHMERAVALKPADPIINDHLGDVYWKVGRKREAMFQWQHARDLKPDEPEVLERVLKKIEHGLDKVELEEAKAGKDDTASN
ncbi:tetratricopeptide repeat protein [Coralliovum pocilloporae]|uniref:tetratricopeptide repeat protein n=1 Tax=Coralliovum pocilloporae TaxID=3066369 RepID=UPI0033075C49